MEQSLEQEIFGKLMEMVADGLIDVMMDDEGELYFAAKPKNKE